VKENVGQCIMRTKRERKATIIPKNLPWGVLLWQLPDGKLFCDQHGNYLSAECFKGDLAAVEKMRLAAAYYGAAQGQTIFMPGRRKISQSEWEDSMEEMIDGKPLHGDIDA
jgi:hypothetical protein